jgi:hypothetical protein
LALGDPVASHQTLKASFRLRHLTYLPFCLCSPNPLFATPVDFVPEVPQKPGTYEVLLPRSEIRSLPLVTLQRAATRAPPIEWLNPISPGERWLVQPSPRVLDEAS